MGQRERERERRQGRRAMSLRGVRPEERSETFGDGVLERRPTKHVAPRTDGNAHSCTMTAAAN